MKPTQPFACQHTPELPELIAELGCSLVVSTYQAGKLIVISSDGERLIQLPRTFDTPMGLAVDESRLAVATKNEILLLANDSRLAASYPKQPGRYDALFVPRSAHFCGQLMVHDMVWTKQGLLAVNTLFSCLIRLDPNFSFSPMWTPPFVSQLAPEDRCHLNGLAVVDGVPRYATALGETDTSGGWRGQKERGGVLIDVESGETILRGLAMPHSPRVYDGDLYVLLSATGEIARVDVETSKIEVIHRVEGFVRGMARIGDHLFVASSRVRKNHTFGDLRLAQEDRSFCGITVLHLPTGARVGELRYARSCEEIYDVQILPGLLRPGILGLADSTHRRALSLPEQTFWGQDEAGTPRRGSSC
ncbi:MAG: TIGR03032 family protein [Deltaproteobacteria bacterium]|nr:TIGR03032 family protein [Deltaproteobacteria bacterium]